MARLIVQTDHGGLAHVPDDDSQPCLAMGDGGAWLTVAEAARAIAAGTLDPCRVCCGS